ncbi:MAG: hypothetical protein ACR2PT_01660 [Endozoicomonas sp.]
MLLAQRVEVLENDMQDLKKVIQANHETLDMLLKEQLSFREVVLQKFDEIDARFAQQDARMDRFEERLDKLEGRMGRLESRFDQMEQSVNSRFDKLERMITTLLAQRS